MSKANKQDRFTIRLPPIDQEFLMRKSQPCDFTRGKFVMGKLIRRLLDVPSSRLEQIEKDEYKRS